MCSLVRFPAQLPTCSLAPFLIPSTAYRRTRSLARSLTRSLTYLLARSTDSCTRSLARLLKHLPTCSLAQPPNYRLEYLFVPSNFHMYLLARSLAHSSSDFPAPRSLASGTRSLVHPLHIIHACSFVSCIWEDSRATWFHLAQFVVDLSAFSSPLREN